MKKTYTTPVMETITEEHTSLLSASSAVSPSSTRTLNKSNDELYGIEKDEDLL